MSINAKLKKIQEANKSLRATTGKEIEKVEESRLPTIEATAYMDDEGKVLQISVGAYAGGFDIQELVIVESGKLSTDWFRIDDEADFAKYAISNAQGLINVLTVITKIQADWKKASGLIYKGWKSGKLAIGDQGKSTVIGGGDAKGIASSVAVNGVDYSLEFGE